MRYEIRVGSLLGREWSEWFDGLEISHDADMTLIAGPLPDEAALHTLLGKVYDLGLALISVRRIETDDASDRLPTKGRGTDRSTHGR